MLPEICFLILVHWNGISSVLEALVKLWYNVHDLKSIFNHARNPLKNKVVQVG
jgi:hypothetical protein